MMRDWNGTYTESRDEPRYGRPPRKAAATRRNATGRGKPPPYGAMQNENAQAVNGAPGRFVSGHRHEYLCYLLVDVVLLPVEGGIGLDDYVFVRGLLQFVDEHGLAGF
jgi:hypothetical protein